jgi:heterodisulfide reductase subunit A-like polyferredoxin
LCADSCQFRAISVLDGIAVVEPGSCMGCGVCVSQCVEGAVALVREPAKGMPLEIQELMGGIAADALNH